LSNEEPLVPAGTPVSQVRLTPLTPDQQARLPVVSSVPTVDTRSEQQKRSDIQATQQALEKWQQESMTSRDGVYFKRDGKWQKAGSFFTESGNLRTDQIAPKVAADVISAVTNTFGFLYDNAGKPILRKAEDVAEPVIETAYKIPGVEFSVGTAADAAGFLGKKSYEYVVKPFIRETMVSLITPFQLLENIIMFAGSQAVFRDNADIQGPKASLLEQLTGIFTNTTMYYESFNRDGVESKGLLPSPELEARRAKFEESLRPTLYGQTATLGRMPAGLLVKFGLVEADDDIHQLISGGLDGLAAVFLDPVNWFAIGKIRGISMLPETPLAPAKQRAVEKMIKAGVVLDPVTFAQAEKVAAAIDDAAVLSNDAIDLLSPKPGIFYSGDRYTPESIISQFNDIDSPDFIVNNNNLLGPGLYISDNPVLGSSYQKNIIDDNALVENLKVPLLDETEGANRLYKFSQPENFNIIDSEAPWTEDANVPWSKTNFAKDFSIEADQIKEIINDLEKSGWVLNNMQEQSIVEPLFDFIDKFNEEPVRIWDVFRDESYSTERFIQNNIDRSFDDFDLKAFVTDQKNLTDDFLLQVGKSIVSSKQATFGGLSQFRSSIEESLRIYDDLLYYSNNTFLPEQAAPNIFSSTAPFRLSAKEIDELSPKLEKLRSIQNKINDIEQSVSSPKTMIKNRKKFVNLINEYVGVTDEFSAILNGPKSLLKESLFLGGNRVLFSPNRVLSNILFYAFDYPSTPLKTINGTLRNGKNYKLDLFSASSKVTVEGAQIGSDAKTDPRYIFNKWLADKGVDAVRYDGGKRIGGYGHHNAMVVLRPSKLEMLDAITGKYLPTNVAKGMIDAGQDLRLSAETMAQAAGFKDAAGLIDGMRKSANPSKYLSWKQRGYAKNLFALIAAEESPSKIWVNFLKQKSPRLAGKLAAAKTAEEVEAIFDIAVSSVDPFEKLWNLPGWSGNIVSEAGYRLKQWTNSKSRIAATLPQTGTLPLDDFAAGAKYLDDALVIVRAAPETRSALMDKYIKIVSQDDPRKIRGDLFDFASEAKRGVITDRLQPLLDRLEAPLEKTTEELTRRERLTMSNRRKIVEELKSYINRNSTWATAGDEITRYTLDDVGRGAPLGWMEGNGLGPMYPSQQNTQGFQILPFDPDELDELVALTERWAVLREQAKTVPGMYQASQALDAMLRGKFGLFNAQTLWKKAVLFTGRYIARVVPEEMTRVQFSGVFAPYEFAYVSEVISGSLNQDILGRVFPYIGEADDIAADLVAAESLETMIGRALGRGDSKLAEKLQRRLDKIDRAGLQSRLNEIENILESEVATARDIMIGPDVGRAADTVLGQNVPGYIKASTQQVVTLSENPKLWRKFKGQMIIERSVSPIAREVARALRSGSEFSIDRIARALVEPVGPFGDIEFALTLRKSYETYFKRQGNVRPGFNWNTIEGAREYVSSVVNDLIQVTDNHPTMLEAIAEGKVTIGDKVINLGRRTAEGNVPSQEFLKLMDEGDEALVGVRPFSQSVDPQNAAAGYPRIDRQLAENRQEAFAWFMRHAYGRASDKFARVPFWNARKWNLIADMAPMLSKQEAAKLRKNITGYGLPKYVEENVLDNLRFAQGEAKLKDLDALAGYQATEDTINLLFDSRKRTLFGRNHRLLFPFFDAFREVSAQLMKTAINPVALHKVDKAVRGLQNTTIGGPGDINADGKREGFIYRDPSTGEMVWNVPIVGQAARAMTGIPFDYKITVGSMSMATSVLPGVGPVASFTYTAIPNRTGKTWDAINRQFIPFGEPSQDVRDYFTPLYLRRISQGLAEGTPFEGISRLLFGDPNQNDTYKMMLNRSVMAELSQGMTTGKYQSNEESIREAMRVGQEKARALWFMRGITQFFAPAAPIAEYYYKTDKELVPLGVLLDRIRENQNQVRANGGSFEDQIDSLIVSFGDQVLPYLASVSENQVPGAEASREFYNFKEQNEELFSSYPDIAGYFGPNTNQYDQEIYNIQRRAGQLRVRGIDEITKEIQQLWGNLRFNGTKSLIEQIYGTSPAASMANSLLEQQIQKDFPSWNRQLAYEEYADRISKNMIEVLKAADDPAVQTLPIYPTLKRYLDIRQSISAEITQKYKLSTVDSWKENKGGIPEREVLKGVGDSLAKENPEFEPLWNNVLSKEFRTLTPQEMRLVQAGQLP
jgi:hypothetical protein